MALREIISNLAIQLDCDIADQKRYCQRKLNKSSSSKPLAILDKIDGRSLKKDVVALPSFSWAISTRHRTKRFSPVRFDLLLLRVLRRWRFISKRLSAFRKMREFATQLVGLRRIRVQRERRSFLKLCLEREEKLYECVGSIMDQRIVSRQRTHLRAWMDLSEAIRFRERAMKSTVMKRWRSKHETHKRVEDFKEFLSARKQLTTLRAWRRRYRERQMKMKFNMPLLGVFLKWRSSSRSSRARALLCELVQKYVDAHCEKSKRFNLRLFRVLSERHSKCEEVARVVETQRIDRVCKNVFRDFQNLLVAREYCRARFRRTYFRRWINTIVRVRHATVVAKEIHGRRVCRYLRMWKRARVDKARERAGTWCSSAWCSRISPSHFFLDNANSIIRITRLLS